MSLIAIDLDGTLIENKWPDLGDWLPGAKEAVQRLLDAGHTVYVYTARCHHLWPNGDLRTEKELVAEFERVRVLLDREGFTDVYIVPKEPYDILIDDKTWRFDGNDWFVVMLNIATILRDDTLYDSLYDMEV